MGVGGRGSVISRLGFGGGEWQLGAWEGEREGAGEGLWGSGVRVDGIQVRVGVRSRGVLGRSNVWV